MLPAVDGEDAILVMAADSMIAREFLASAQQRLDPRFGVAVNDSVRHIADHPWAVAAVPAILAITGDRPFNLQGVGRNDRRRLHDYARQLDSAMIALKAPGQGNLSLDSSFQARAVFPARNLTARQLGDR
ncbi:hypothetical protein [Streptomyces sp. NPDC051776]|uniref:hypothetical protein n=1 Tax=Streptomyces sp. NPDC051776 TaxID=3155414 RepID=UPI0034465E85